MSPSNYSGIPQKCELMTLPSCDCTFGGGDNKSLQLSPQALLFECQRQPGANCEYVASIGGAAELYVRAPPAVSRW